MNLHTSELGWTEYCVQGVKHLSNHHIVDGLIKERVTPETATHAIVVEVERIGDKPQITSVDTIEVNK